VGQAIAFCGLLPDRNRTDDKKRLRYFCAAVFDRQVHAGSSERRDSRYALRGDESGSNAR
jgi:hypothetical protein